MGGAERSPAKLRLAGLGAGRGRGAEIDVVALRAMRADRHR